MISLTAKATKTQLDWVTYIKKTLANPNYPQTWGINITIEEFVKLTFEKAIEQGVNPDVLLTMFIVEKSWTMAGGYVPPLAHNPGNLGATDGTGKYNVFKDWATGIRGAAQHLAIYAGVPLIEPIDDPRAAIANWGYFGIVNFADELGGTVNGKSLWSTQVGYGDIIVGIINKVPSTLIPETPIIVEEPPVVVPPIKEEPPIEQPPVITPPVEEPIIDDPVGGPVVDPTPEPIPEPIAPKKKGGKNKKWRSIVLKIEM